MALGYRVWDPRGDVTLVLKYRNPQKPVSSPSGNLLLDNDDEIPEAPVENEQQEQTECRMRVSSKHLALASPVFDAMLTGGFAEAQTLREKGCLELPLPEDEPEAMALLMSIIHADTKGLPNTLDEQFGTKELADFAILVDKYQVHGRTEFFTDMWVQTLKLPWSPRKTKARKSDMLLLTIFWVFGLADEFEELTKFLIVHSPDLFNPPDEYEGRLPLPPTVMDAMAKARADGIQDILDYIVESTDRYQQHSVVRCDEDCDALMLGTLIRARIQAGIWPSPSPPFIGISFRGISEAINFDDIASFCYRNTGHHCEYSNYAAMVAEKISDILIQVEDVLGGLKLEDFQRSSKT